MAIRSLAQRRVRAPVVLAWLFGCLVPGGALAADWQLGELQIENDFLFPTGVSHSGDRYYTSGLRAVWLRDPAAGLPRWAEGVRNLWCGEDDECVAGYRPQVGFAIGQQSFTPHRLDVAEPQPADRPWAGFLFGSMILQLESDDRQQVFSLQVGVTGPPSGAEQLQQGVHEVIGDERAAGWDNQLPFEPTVNLYYLASRRVPLTARSPAVEMDLVPHIGAALGTVMTYVNAGATLRLGRQLRGFPYRTLESSTINGPVGRAALRSFYYFFAGFDARAVVRNLFLDGTLFRSSPSVDKRSFVYDLNAGFVYRFTGGTQITISGTRRSEEFRPPSGQTGTHGFVSLSASVPFR